MSGITLSYFFEKQINIFFRKALKTGRSEREICYGGTALCNDKKELRKT